MDKMRVDRLKIPRQYDRRVKLEQEDREKAIFLRKNNGLTYQAIANKLGVSKTLIIYICNPDIYERKKAQAKERRKDGRYYNKDKWRLVMREHRAYKKQVGVSDDDKIEA